MTGPVDTLEPPAPAVEPRIWQRRVVVLREQGRRRLRWVIAGAAVVVLVVVLLVVLHSPVLALRHIWVRGATNTGTAAVVDAAGLSGSTPLVDIDTAATASRVERLPWVARAVVTRNWPDGVTVTVTERVPVAGIAHPGSGPVREYALVDAGGHVLTWSPAVPPGLPTLVAPVAPGPGGTVLAEADRPGLSVVGALPPALTARVLRVVVAPGARIWLDLGHRQSVALGAASHLPAKLAALTSVLAAGPASGAAVIDVTVPDEPTVGPPTAGAPPWR